jgi:DNA-binding winged helix-turn-helix (wHTH) protein
MDGRGPADTVEFTGVFARFRLYLNEPRGLYRLDQTLGEVPVRVGNAAFHLLRLLLEQKGRPVSKKALKSEAWGTEDDAGDWDDNLRVEIGKLRASLGENAHNSCIQREMKGGGYRYNEHEIPVPSNAEQSGGGWPVTPTIPGAAEAKDLPTAAPRRLARRIVLAGIGASVAIAGGAATWYWSTKGQPINAPLASFMRSNDDWSVTLSFTEPVTAIAWRLGETGPFKETGFLDTLDPRTRRRIANPTFELDPEQAATTIEVRAVDLDGNAVGPFPITFDPVTELERGDRRTLEMTRGSWLSFGKSSSGGLLYYTHLMTYRCAIREARIGVDSTMPNRVVPLGDCDPKDPYGIPADAQPYLKLPPTTQMVSVELTYRDGSVSETKTFRR